MKAIRLSFYMRNFSSVFTSDVCGFLNALNINFEDDWRLEFQNLHYHGCKYDVLYSAIIIFAPDGCIIYASINAPGSCRKPFTIRISESTSPLTEEYALVWPSTFLYRDPFEHDGSQLSVSAVTFDSRGSKELASVLWPWNDFSIWFSLPSLRVQSGFIDERSMVN